MRISIFGLGYVGAVSAGCLASDGHQVIGVDPNRTKVDLTARGMTPIIEKDIGEMIAGAVAAGRLRATCDVREAVMGSDVSLICVGTPSQINGNLDLSYVRRVCEEIGDALRDKASFHVVVARSTMLPGSMRDVVIPTLEACSGKTAGKDFGVCNNPEFLRLVDAFHEPRQHFSRATLNLMGHPLCSQSSDRSGPLYWLKQLVHQTLPNALGIRDHACVHIVDHGNLRRLNVQIDKQRLQALSGPAHQQTVGGGADRKRQCPFGPCGLCTFDRSLHGCSAPGNHNLARTYNSGNVNRSCEWTTKTWCEHLPLPSYWL